MDYKKKIIALMNDNELSQDKKEKLMQIFPELAESEDERIKKGIKSILEHYKESGEVVCPYPFVSIDEALAWLEKQGESNLTKKAVIWLESVNLDYYQIREGVFSKELVEDFKKYMEA